MENVYLLANDKINLGKALIEKLNSFKNIAGVQKIQRKINQEIKFLEKVTKSKTLKINHVMCSNLTHYEFLIQVLLKQIDIIHVDCGFNIDDREKPIRVDIVCENGSKWIKVIARNPKSINDTANGRGSYGAKSIVDQANEYILAAQQNSYMFKQPKVCFYFSHQIDNNILESIKSSGVEPYMNDNSVYTNSTDSDNTNSLNLLNLDITTMLAYVSALTNGSYKWTFQEPLLTEQAEREHQTPLRPILDELFKDKKLLCCKTALNSFQDILSLLGGPEEKKRADCLIDRMEILDDIEEISQEFSVLCVAGKIKPRSLKIFAFGVVMKAVTVTSNEGFVRSAKMQGIDVPVIIHQARALTEMKEKTAVPSHFEYRTSVTNIDNTY